MTSTTLTDALTQMTREHALLDPKQVACLLGVTAWWVRRLIADGELRAINVGGPEKAARWRVDPEDVKAFMRTRESRARDLVA